VGRAFVHLMKIDRGFDRTGVITATVSLEGTAIQTDAGRMIYFQEALARIRRLPGVQSASTTQFLPLDAKGFIGGRYRLDGRPASTNSSNIPVMPDYFRTMGGRIVAGREFTEADMQSDAPVAIVNQVFAREFGQPADLLGRQLSNGDTARKIVGVVRGMDYMTDGANSSQVFTLSRSPGWPGSTFVVKVAGRAEDRLAIVRDTIRSVDPQVPVFGVKTMDRRMAENFARPQFYRTALTFFAAFALLLAIIGIYGIVSYSVARRTHEMGVRMALGATPEDLRVVLLRQGLLPIVAGAIPGIALAILSGRLLESLVEGARSVEPAAYAGAVLFIAAIAAAGIWIATHPIAKLDITEILRTD
jgi:putative ABC transport system permease protein